MIILYQKHDYLFWNMITNADEATVFLYINQLYNCCKSIKIDARETIML